MKKHIPNLITCMNVTSGTVAIYAAVPCCLARDFGDGI